ncbi:MAG: hypothetical protein LBT83_01675 [Tannerella sp.]|jgi:hypothetical protein|nr:hypothetical protein [Tannerella sp.]
MTTVLEALGDFVAGVNFYDDMKCGDKKEFISRFMKLFFYQLTLYAINVLPWRT